MLQITITDPFTLTAHERKSLAHLLWPTVEPSRLPVAEGEPVIEFKTEPGVGAAEKGDVLAQFFDSIGNQGPAPETLANIVDEHGAAQPAEGYRADLLVAPTRVDVFGETKVDPAQIAPADRPDTGALNPADIFKGGATPSVPPIPPVPGVAAHASQPANTPSAPAASTGPSAPTAGAASTPPTAASSVASSPSDAPSNTSSAPMPGTPTSSPPAPTNALDTRGLPWDARIHSSTRVKTAEGVWRRKRGVDEELVAKVEGELRALIAIPAAGTATPVAPPAPPLPPGTPPVPPANDLRFSLMMGKLAEWRATGVFTYEQITETLKSMWPEIGSLIKLSARPDLAEQFQARLAEMAKGGAQ